MIFDRASCIGCRDPRGRQSSRSCDCLSTVMWSISSIWVNDSTWQVLITTSVPRDSLLSVSFFPSRDVSAHVRSLRNKLKPGSRSISDQGGETPDHSFELRPEYSPDRTSNNIDPIIAPFSTHSPILCSCLVDDTSRGTDVDDLA